MYLSSGDCHLHRSIGYESTAAQWTLDSRLVVWVAGGGG